MNNKKSNDVSNKLDFKIINILLKIIAFVFMIITIIFYISILKLNLLPNSYIIIFTIAELVFTTLMIIGLAKKHKSYALNILCLIIILLLSGVYLYVSNYANATTEFLKNMFQDLVETEEYYVIVKKDSNYNVIEDIDKEVIYAFQIEDDVKKDIESKVSITFETDNSLTYLGKKLIDDKLNVILVSSSQYDLLSEEIQDFKSDTKIIYISKHEIQKSDTLNTQDSKFIIENEIFNVYITGIDAEGGINKVARSDANIIATVNTKTNEILLTSIPRDYYVTLHSKNEKDKLTHSGLYGVDETIGTVEDLLDIDINYYIRVNFTTVMNLIDILGGVDVYSEYEFTSSSTGYKYEKGYNYLNGREALWFSRERYAFEDGDNQRIKNQQAVIEAIINKVINSTALLTKYTDILETLQTSLQTNIGQEEISDLVKLQVQNKPIWKIKNNTLTGTGEYMPTYSIGTLKSYVIIPDEKSIENAKEQINELIEE